jgi:5-methyltetrahydropteroyltriglutamate--homocysteine methyltransferase
MRTSVIGYPRIGKDRELKFAVEKYFSGDLSKEEMLQTAKMLRKEHWEKQDFIGIDFISSNDFSFYDNVLDTAILLNTVPQRYKDIGLDDLDTYFAMARGYQSSRGDVKALTMKKWFNTNYHYMVTEIEDNTEIKLIGTKPFDEFLEVQNAGITTKPVLIGAYTFLKLAKITGKKKTTDYLDDIATAYAKILCRFEELGANWLQFDEPALVMDMTETDIEIFTVLYKKILSRKNKVKVLLQTYFGDVRDCYDELQSLSFDGIGLDFVEGEENLNLIKEKGFDNKKTLFAGIINGKNIWKNSYEKSTQIISELKMQIKNIVLNTSCSLLHVPYTLDNETILSEKYSSYLAFAEEKLSELVDLKEILLSSHPALHKKYLKNQEKFKQKRYEENALLNKKISSLTDDDFVRHPAFAVRERIQKERFKLPVLPTTTIGSFPQTRDVRANRNNFKKEKITKEQYISFNKQKIAECIALQEKIGLDVLVHGEFERNDMVEYFGEVLDGFIFTQKAWVQSYGTRCVKPPIIWGDVSRSKPITVEYSKYAQSLTSKPVKGMLTGPVTILNWSFPREDISLKKSVLQIALAIREEVLDLEKNGISVIQIDEAALREKLPLRKTDWHNQYLDWAIDAFCLVHSGVLPQTQIHTHMCYSEFSDIIIEIEKMDADVISFEASRSDLKIVNALHAAHFKTEVGPGVYDIHSPRVPTVFEIKTALLKILDKIPKEKLWVNPDCGLKTRGKAETIKSLENLVCAAKEIRKQLEQ